MTTTNDKQKELQAFWDAEKAYINKIMSVIRAILNNLANIADIISRYAGITGMLATSANIASMLPAAVIGPIASIFHLVVTLSNNNTSLPSKLVNLITTSGSSGASLVSVILHSIAIPLIIVSASFGLIKECWGLSELLYRRYYKNDTSVTSKEWFDAVQGVVLASISVVAASLLLFPPAIPIAYALFALTGVYKLLDSIGKNPIKMILGLYESENQGVETSEASTVTIQSRLENNVGLHATATTVSCAAMTLEKPIDSKTLKVKSRFSPCYFSLTTNNVERYKTDNTAATLSMKRS